MKNVTSGISEYKKTIRKSKQNQVFTKVDKQNL